MATQAEVDAVTAALGTVGEALTRGLDEVQSEIARLNEQLSQGNSIDLSALSNAVASVQSQATALDNVVPDALPEPDPEPETPVDTTSPGDVSTDEGTTDAPGDPEVTWPPVVNEDNESV